jgi:hypothetical protein
MRTETRNTIMNDLGKIESALSMLAAVRMHFSTHNEEYRRELDKALKEGGEGLAAIMDARLIKIKTQ